jgi:hypothetical protein
MPESPRYVYLDIETVPADPEGPDADSLHILRARMVALAVVSWCSPEPDDTEPAVLVVDPEQSPEDGERWILECLRGYLADVGITRQNPGIIVGHNVIAFDIPRLWIRALRYRHPLQAWFPPNVPAWKQDRVVDTLRLVDGGNRENAVKLTDVARYLGIPVEEDPGPGANVRAWWKAGRLDTIAAHVRSDVITCRAVHRRLLGA